jgi:hypothetical protein
MGTRNCEMCGHFLKHTEDGVCKKCKSFADLEKVCKTLQNKLNVYRICYWSIVVYLIYLILCNIFK